VNPIRPPDPAIRGTTLAYMMIRSHDAARRLIHLVFRDAHTALDLTYAEGGFWRAPLPPGLGLVTNDIDRSGRTDLHLDFTATGLPDGAFDLVCYDPPHLADGGKRSIMARRYGTVKGTDGLRALIVAGCAEAWRVARVGLLVKVTESSHSSQFERVSDWVVSAVPARPYAQMHTVRPTNLRDGKWRVTRVPRNNGAAYLAFRKDGHRHRNFDRLYAAQQARMRRAG
jgi:hypothetical protein